MQIMPVIICWNIWRARNKAKYNSTSQPYSLVISNIVKLVTKCLKIQFPKNRINTANWFTLLDSISNFTWKISVLQVMWDKAPIGYTLNTDGSSILHSSSASGGGILRDSSGKFIFAFSAFFGYGSNMCAETLSLLVGLFICNKLQVQSVAIRCYSKIIIDMLAGSSRVPWHIQPLFRKISRYKSLITDAKHCYRESNSIADTLAKEAQQHKTFRFDSSISQTSNAVRTLIQMECWNSCKFRFTKNIA